MPMKKCDFCKKNDVPENGQCNNCGFIDGIARQPSPADFKKARELNKKNKYDQFVNLDMLLLDE